MLIYAPVETLPYPKGVRTPCGLTQKLLRHTKGQLMQTCTSHEARNLEAKMKA